MSQGLTIRHLGSGDYAERFGCHTANFFDSPQFALLNSGKTGKVEWLCFFDEKGSSRAGLICGTTEGITETPFSAPYAFFTLTKKLGASRWRQLAEALTEGGVDYITLPPLCYGEEVQKAAAALISAGWTVEYADTNYHIDLTRNPDTLFDSKARGHLRKAMKSGVEIVKLAPDCSTDVERAYGIIERNRESRGYPLRMSLREVTETISLCGGEIYVAHTGDMDIASAIVYKVAPDKAQLIYWGDTREYPELCGMYALAAEMTWDMKASGYKMVDLGPSSSHGTVAAGQCDFKESVGGEMSIKFRLRNPHRH